MKLIDQSKTKNIVGIDIFKLIMAIFVVAIHTHPFESIHNPVFLQIYNIVISTAVPYFFIASGYFLFLKIDKDWSLNDKLTRIRNYIVKIIRLYLVWTIIYIPLTLFEYINNDKGVLFDSILFLRGLFLLGEHYYSWPLWYLLSLIYSLILIFILIKMKKNLKFIFITSIIVYLFSIFLNIILKEGSQPICTSSIIRILYVGIGSGRLFSGMFFITIGIFFAYFKIHLSYYRLIPFAIVGLLAQILNIKNITDLAIIPIAILLFQTSLKTNYSNVKLGYVCRRISNVMYFSHMIVFFLYTLIFKEFRYFGLDAFVISASVSLLLSYLVLRFENRVKWLKEIF